MYVVQVYAVVFATLRLRKGLPATFEVRKKCATETFACLWIYFIYIAIISLFFLIICAKFDNNSKSFDNFTLFFVYFMANRGTLDGYCWFTLHDFVREDRPGIIDGAMWVFDWIRMRISRLMNDYRGIPNEKTEDESLTEIQQSGTSYWEQWKNMKARLNMDDIMGEAASAASTIDFDETDLSPQVNVALRQQIVRYVTTGIRDACYCQNLSGLEPSLFVKILKAIPFSHYVYDTKDPASVPGISEVEFLLEGQHPFKAYASDIFKELRECEGIDELKYIDTLSSTSKERLSEV